MKIKLDSRSGKLVGLVGMIHIDGNAVQVVDIATKHLDIVHANQVEVTIEPVFEVKTF